jgi:tetratricopeptide (TPR) repeat protein
MDTLMIQLRHIPSAILLLIILTGSGCRKEGESGVAETAEQRAGEPVAVKAEHVGRQACIDCHKRQYDLYIGSDHDMAMDVATEENVLGDFDNAVFDHLGTKSRFFKHDGNFYVNTEGADGEFQDFQIKYVFGIRPLQQYLIEFPGGAYQCLPLCWDTRPKEDGGQRWFHIYGDERIEPSDILFWTRITQNWNYMCSECHSTNLRKQYDRFEEEYNTVWSEIDVSCEACHGPGSEHVEWAEAADRGQRFETTGYLGLVIRLKETDGATWVFRDPEKGTAERTVPKRTQALVEMCARCHARRSLVHEPYVHNRPFLDTHTPSVLEEQLYYPDGQIYEEVYVYGSFLQSKMFQAGVGCRDCHEPHSGKVFIQGNALCYRCHLQEKFGVHSHHFHKEDSTGNLCVECHMVERTYMVVDPRRDHSMRVPRPDLSDRLETPNACIQCHDHKDKSNRWAADYCRQWYGALQDGQTHYGEIFHAGRRGYPEAVGGLIGLANNRQNPPMQRATALLLLGNYPSQEAFSAIRHNVNDPDPLIRAMAVQSLEMVNTNERIPLIKHLLKDPVRLVRVRTAFSLAAVSRNQMTREERRLLDIALEDYKQVQYINADHPTSHLNLGVLATQEGDQTAAEAEYRKAIELEPMLSHTYINLADLYRSQGRDDLGEKVLKQALELNPSFSDVYHALGLLFVRQKNYSKALEHLKKATELAQENARFNYVYGIALHSRQKSQDALEVLKNALNFHPYDRDLLYALTTINRDLGNFEEALEYTQKLIELYPQDQSFRQLEQLLRSQL